MTETWYEMAVRELSELTDPARERLMEAAETAPVLPEPEAEDEEPPAADAA